MRRLLSPLAPLLVLGLCAAGAVYAWRENSKTVMFVADGQLWGTKEGGPDDVRPGTYDEGRCLAVFGNDCVTMKVEQPSPGKEWLYYPSPAHWKCEEQIRYWGCRPHDSGS